MEKTRKELTKVLQELYSRKAWEKTRLLELEDEIAHVKDWQQRTNGMIQSVEQRRSVTA